MHEELTCISCNKKWSREKSRGRKPKLCSDCLNKKIDISNKDLFTTSLVSIPKSNPPLDITLNTVFQLIHPRHPEAEKLSQETAKGSSWRCTSCGNVINLLIAITAPPTHRCTPDMVSVKPYERIK